MNAEYYKLLNEFISFKTISGDENCKQEFKNCADWLENLLKGNGFFVKNIIKYGSPIILANFMTSPDAETVLIYGNYDTTFAEKKEGWKDDPFSLYLGKDKIIGRGVAEGKGSLILQILSIINLIKENKLKYNITFLIEGERFSGSLGLKTLLQESLFLSEEGLSADMVLTSIGTQAGDIPNITTSFRGGFTTKIDLKSFNKKIDTERFGGMLSNPAIEGCKLISKIKDSHDQLMIPYFYYDIENISVNEKIVNGRINFDESELLSSLDAKKLNIESDTNFYSKIGYKPSLDVISFSAGDGFTLPDSATIVLDMKLVANQKSLAIQNLFENWIELNMPNNIDYKLTFSNFADPIKINVQNIYISDAVKKLEYYFGKKVIFIASSFVLPIAKIIQEKISENIVNIPLMNRDCNIHTVMENFDINLIEKSYNFMYEYLKK